MFWGEEFGGNLTIFIAVDQHMLGSRHKSNVELVGQGIANVASALFGGIPATVQVVEPTGSETQVLMKVGNQSMVGAFRERVSAKPGEILPVRPDPALVHLFDQQSGQRL